MASGSRKLGPREDLLSLAELLRIHPENFGTFGRLRDICLISTSSRLYPRYRSLVGIFSSRSDFIILFLMNFFGFIRRDRKVATFNSEFSTSGNIINNLISSFVNSSHSNFNQRYSTTTARDPCEYTSSRSSVPFSRLVETVIPKVLKPPLNLGKPDLAVVIQRIFRS